MKNKFKYLVSISLKRKIKTKWFLAANILLAVVIALVLNIDNIIKSFGGDFSDTTKIYVVDNVSSFDVFNENMNAIIKEYDGDGSYKIEKITKTKDEVLEFLKTDEEKDSIVLIIDDGEDVISVEMISNDYIDTITSSMLSMSLNGTKSYLAVKKYNISPEQVSSLVNPATINRTILDESKDSSEENMATIMTTIFPVFILPFFMLVIFLVQMIGAEVNDEKSTRGMEIIISNVSPKVHFFSKCVAGNIFIIFQSLLLIAYVAVGLFLRLAFNDFQLSGVTSQISELVNEYLPTEFISSLYYVIPFVLILMLLSFVAYSLLAGILASMTTNTEDFQQIQTPIMLINLAGYYLAIMAGGFKGSILIKVLGYVPFISSILSPSLLVMGEFTIIDMFISIGLVALVIFLLIRYGLRIYKVGILNYSSGNLWKKMLNALKNK